MGLPCSPQILEVGGAVLVELVVTGATAEVVGLVAAAEVVAEGTGLIATG